MIGTDGDVDDYDPYTGMLPQQDRECFQSVRPQATRSTPRKSIKDLKKVPTYGSDPKGKGTVIHTLIKNPDDLPPTVFSRVNAQTPSEAREREQYGNPEYYASSGCPFCVHIMK